MVNFITKSFSKLDIFGSEVSLNYEKDNVFKTSFGGFISLAFISFIGVFFWSSGFYFFKINCIIILLMLQYFYFKETVYVSQSRQFDIEPPNIELDVNNFMFAVKIDHDDFIKKPLFNITLEQRDYVLHPNGTRVKNKYPLPLVPCTEKHWTMLQSYGTNWTEKYINFNFQSFLCPKLDQKLTIGGTYNNNHYFHLKLSVVKCSNKYLDSAVWRPTCANDTEINTFFSKNTNVRFLLYTNNFLLNPLHNDNYVTNFVEDSLFFSIQKTGAYQTADIYYTQNNVITDESILPFQNIKNETFLTYQSGNFRPQYVVGPIDNIFAEFYMRKDSFSYSINRSFQKISEIISYIGGFSQIFIIMAAILVNYYNEYVYAISLANKIYDFHFTQDNKKKGQKANEINQAFQSSGVNAASQYIINDINQSSNKQNNSISKNKEKNNILSDNSISIQIDDVGKNNLKMQKKSSKQDKDTKDEMISPSKGKKKITSREQDGLLPLDKIKNIISQRSSFILKNLTSLKTPERNIDNNYKNYSYNGSYQNDNHIAEEQENQSRISGEYQVEILDADSERQDNKFSQSQSDLGLYQKIQYNTQKVEQKDELNDSINPETPLPRNELQSPFKLGKKNLQQQINNLNQNQQQIINYQSQQQQSKQKEIQQNSQDIQQNQQQQIENQKYINQSLQNNQIELIQLQLEKEQQPQISKQELQFSKSELQSQVNGNNIMNNESIVDQKNDGMFDFGISSNHAILRRSTQEQIGQIQVRTPTTKSNEAQEVKKIQDIGDKNIQNKLFEGLGFKNKKQFLTKEFEFILKRDSSIQMTFKYFLYKLTCKKLFRSELVLLLDKANKQMKRDLDIFMIINRLKELEKFKCLFLDKHQEILFNFFPKPVISIQNKQENLSRAEITEQVRGRNDSNAKKTQDKISVKGDQQRKLKINFKTAALVSKAATQFKKPIIEKINEFNNMIAYKKLYEAYEKTLAQGETQFNKKLIEQLGEEMNKIFEISNMIPFKDNTNNAGGAIKQKEVQFINWDSNNSLYGKNNEKNKTKQHDVTRPKTLSLFNINNKNEQSDVQVYKKILLSDDQPFSEKQLASEQQFKNS